MITPAIIITTILFTIERIKMHYSQILSKTNKKSGILTYIPHAPLIPRPPFQPHHEQLYKLQPHIYDTDRYAPPPSATPHAAPPAHRQPPRQPPQAKGPANYTSLKSPSFNDGNKLNALNSLWDRDKPVQVILRYIWHSIPQNLKMNDVR